MSELQRYGLEWKSDTDFIAKPMDDGYWTPWHIAQVRLTAVQAENEALRARVAELESDIFSACAEVLEREAEAIGSKQGLGRRMARLRIACLAQRLRDQDAALAAHRKQEPSHDNQ